MSYLEELRFFWDLVWHPGKASKRKLDLGGAVKLYYKVALLPFIAYVVLGAIAVMLGITAAAISPGSMFHSLGGFAKSLAYGFVLIRAIFLFFIALPLSIAVDALLYQLVGKWFLNAWKGNYEKTFSALVFALFPLLLLLWLSVIPFLSSIFIILAPIWSIVVLVIALSAQQNITRLNAVLVIILKLILIFVVLLLIGLSVFTAIAYLTTGVLHTTGMMYPFGHTAISNWLTHMGNTPVNSAG